MPIVQVTFIREDSTQRAPFFPLGGGASVPTRAGETGIFVRHPRVLLLLGNGSNAVVHGTLYVQRQHNLEV